MNLYKTYRWQKLRLRALRRDNFECQWCKLQGKVKKATVVHHKDKNINLFFVLKNLVSLCRECHEKHHGRLKEYKDDERFPEWW